MQEHSVVLGGHLVPTVTLLSGVFFARAWWARGAYPTQMRYTAILLILKLFTYSSGFIGSNSRPITLKRL